MNQIINELKKNKIHFEENVDLSKLSTLRVKQTARLFVKTSTVKELKDFLGITKDKNIRIIVIGDASNILFTEDFEGIILKPSLTGIHRTEENEESVTLKVGAGEDWHGFVEHCVDNELGGVENLALIPGTVGAAPVQNIAAYGHNLTDTFIALEAIEIKTGKVKTFEKEDMGFEYRSSVFKRELKNKWIIMNVTFKLSKEFKLEANYHERKGRYGSLEDALKEVATKPYTIRDAFNAVVYIRSRKLPDPEKVGTCGSFFKNPVVTKDQFAKLSERVSELQSYPADNLDYKIKNWNEVKDDYVKIPAARLIDELGWKGKWEGNVGVYKNHALCIVTKDNATGSEVIKFMKALQQDVKKNFGISLEPEVLFYP